MTGTSLLEQFLAEECSPYVRRMLEDALGKNASRRFEFNRFEVTIDRAAEVVVLDDVLHSTDAGRQQAPLADFAAALRRCSAQ